MQHETYEPFELFVRDDLWIQNDFREIPRVGFFEEAFRFPVVKEAGREWMAVKPSEIETMKPAISEVSGRVAALGLGLGYFPFMAARKLEVDRVVVVERDAESIALFEKFILPQFQDPKKIEIVESDAFEFLARTHSAHGFDFVFVDLWHDAFDGLKLYLRTKEFEYKNDSVRFLYWVESSLISAFRWRKFHDVVEKAATFEEVLKELKYDSERCRS